MKESAVTFELLEPPSPEALVPDSPSYQVYWFAAAVVILLAVILLLSVKKKRKSDPFTARKVAYTYATEALASIDSPAAREVAIQASYILRKYLSIAARDPALFETHEETIARHAFTEFTEETRTAAVIGFHDLVALKYAPESPGITSESVKERSSALLEILHQGYAA